MRVDVAGGRQGSGQVISQAGPALDPARQTLGARNGRHNGAATPADGGDGGGSH